MARGARRDPPSPNAAPGAEAASPRSPVVLPIALFPRVPPLELLKRGRRYKPCVLAHEGLLGDFAPADLVGGPRRPTVGFYAVKLDGQTDKRWRVLAYSGESKNEALAVSCDYGKGKVILNQFAVLDRIYEPIMRTLMVTTVRYVLSGD